jgi:nitroreductase
MSENSLNSDVIKNAVQLACRAPSLHNSQPWRWVADDGGLRLFADPSRIGHHTDSTGREVIISCGAVLDHLRVAAAAAGWHAATERLPNPNDPNHLASIEFRRMDFVSDYQRALGEAIGRRRTDRLPFAAPAGWDEFEPILRSVIDEHAVHLDVVDDDGRPALATVSRLTEHLRQHDAMYEAELLWWTGYTDESEGIRPTALVSETEAARVDVGRHFPAGADGNRRPSIERDHSLVLVLSTYDDSRENVLRCGEALSTVLLECTAAGLATCTLTHMIEIHSSREAVRRLIGRIAEPQVLIRVGQAPQEAPPPLTARRPLTDVLQIC